MQTDASPVRPARLSSYFNKLKHPSQFSKPQLAIFILAFAIIGYLLVRVFAAAPLIATLESESMTPNLPVASPSTTGFVTTLTPNMTLTTPYLWAFNPPTATTAGYFFVDGKQLAKINGPGPYALRLAPGMLTAGARTLGHSWDTTSGIHQAPAQSYPVTIVNGTNTDFVTTLKQNMAVNTPYLWGFDAGTSTKAGYFFADGKQLQKQNHAGPYVWVLNPGTLSNGSHTLGHSWDTTTGFHRAPSQSYPVTINNSTPAAGGTASTIADTTASAGKAEKFSAGVSLSGSVSLLSAGTSLTVVAHGEQCSIGGWPTMTISLDGTQVLSTSVSSTSWTSYSITKSMAVGSHSLTITNASSGACVPNLYADVTNFFGVALAKPTIPTGLVATTGNGQVKLTWNPNPSSDQVDTYQVYVNDSNNAPSNLSVSGTSYTVTGLTNGTSYNFRVSAHNSVGYGDWTAAIPATPTASTTSSPINIGETKVLTGLDSNNANLLLAQKATLSQTATIQSLSFYVRVAAGNLRLGIYDATGPNGGPGNLMAYSANTAVTTNGWDTLPVTGPVSLNAGTYWLAYLPDNNNLGFYKADDSTSSGVYYSYSATNSQLPGTFSTSPNTTASHWSFYATLNTSGSGTPTPPPPPPPTPPPSPTGTVYFDGRAKNMISMNSTGIAQNNNIVQSQSPQTWDCLCFTNNDMQIASDSRYGKIYTIRAGYGSHNPYNTGADLNNAASAEVSHRQAMTMGRWDWYSNAYYVKTPFTQTPWMVFYQYGYPTLSSPPVSFNADDSGTGTPTWDIQMNSGLLTKTSTGFYRGANADRYTLQPIQFNSWVEVIMGVKWETNNTGELHVYMRNPSVTSTWTQIVNKVGIATEQYGTTSYGTCSADYHECPTIIDHGGIYFGYWDDSTPIPTNYDNQMGMVDSSDLTTAQSVFP